MWLNAQERVKEQLRELDARLVGAIALDDRHSNITSTVSIVRWMLTGQKRARGWSAEAGVSGMDIRAARRFGPTILDWLEAGQPDNALQPQLLAQGAIRLRPSLVILERRGARLFPNWAIRARRLGPRGDPARQKVLKKFKIALFVSIFILSPVSAGLAKLTTIVQRKKVMNDVNYFSGTAYVKGKIGREFPKDDPLASRVNGGSRE
jgi:hypothetical protein